FADEHGVRWELELLKDESEDIEDEQDRRGLGVERRRRDDDDSKGEQPEQPEQPEQDQALVTDLPSVLLQDWDKNIPDDARKYIPEDWDKNIPEEYRKYIPKEYRPKHKDAKGKGKDRPRRSRRDEMGIATLDGLPQDASDAA
ncbi:hypothetical protein HaLaN_32205, partial [Haematococcus lacustris]